MEPFEITVTRDQSSKTHRSSLLLILGVIVFVVNIGILIKQLVESNFENEIPGSWAYVGNTCLGLAIVLGYYRKNKSRSIRFDGQSLYYQPERGNENLSFNMKDIAEVRHYATSAEVRLNNGKKHLVPLGQLTYLDVQRMKALLSDSPHENK